MSDFETNLKSLRGILNQINIGELALPNFQRDFVWDPGATEELIESIMRQYPAGSLLFLKHEGAGFNIREFAGAPKLDSKSGTSYLVLDGQQRLTSLYQAFYGQGEHRFFLSLKPLLERSDIEEAVWHESLTRCRRKGYLDIETQAEKLICPLEVIMGRKGGFHAWVDEVIENLGDGDQDTKKLRSDLRIVFETWISPIPEYPFPVVTLPGNTALDAVCRMFETLNRRGVKLGPFELLMARSFADKISLRDMWEQGLQTYPALEDFEIDPYYLLQIICLLDSPSIKRSDVLNLSPKVIELHWSSAVEALGECLSFMRKDLGVLSPNWLPYTTMLVPMAATWIDIKKLTGPKVALAKGKISKWFWASVFSQAYEQGPTSRAVGDYKELLRWIKDDGAEPKALRALYFNPNNFLDVTSKQRALYRGTIALVLSAGATDFHNGEKLTYDYLIRGKMDDHHIFPRGYLKGRFPESKANCVLNRTLIDKKTNIRINDNSPSKYVQDIIKELGENKTRAVFESHLIPFETLQKDDFDSFLQQRANLLFAALEKALDRQIPRGSPIVDEEEYAPEEDEAITIRDKVDPVELNANPEEALAALAPWVRQLFDTFITGVTKLDSNVWWRTRGSKVRFFSPDKNFMVVTISRKGLRFRVFTRGQTMPGVTPIIQKDRGGELWGRGGIGQGGDMKVFENIVKLSLERMKQAIAAKEKTSWWAMSKNETE